MSDAPERIWASVNKFGVFGATAHQKPSVGNWVQYVRFETVLKLVRDMENIDSAFWDEETREIISRLRRPIHPNAREEARRNLVQYDKRPNEWG